MSAEYLLYQRTFSPCLIKSKFHFTLNQYISTIDLSKVDFDSLKKWLDKNRKHTQAEILKNAIQAKLAALVQLNKSRIDFAERFQQLIDEYNAGAVNVELFFKNLV